METGLKLFLCLASLACTISCIQEENAPESVNEEKTITFTAYTDEGIESTEAKSILHTDGVSVHWESNDQILVFSNTTNGVLSENAVVLSDPKRANFVVKTPLADTYYAMYPPYEKASYSTDYNYITANLPTQQTAVNGSFGHNTNLAIAKSEEEKLFFRNVGAILAIKNPSNYAGSIKIVSRDENVKMTGEASISYNHGEPKVVDSNKAVNYVEFNGGMSNTKDQIFNAVVYPGNYASGFDVIIASSSTPYARATYSSTKALDLKRNDNYMLFELPDGKFAWNSIAGPTSVNVAVGWKSATVSWTWNYTMNTNEVFSRTGYVVYVRKSGTTENIKTIPINDADTYSAEVNDLDIDTYYDFGVQVTRTNGKPSEIEWKKNVWINGYKCIPPILVKIEQTDEDQVTLTWQDKTNAEKNYRIWKQEIGDGENGGNTKDLPANTTTYQSSVIAGHTYRFGVQALHENDPENNSEIVFFDPFVALTWEELIKVDKGWEECILPEIKHIVQNDNTSATLTWTCGSGAAVGYNLYMREASDIEWHKSHLKTTHPKNGVGVEEEYTFTELNNGTTYYFGVQAIGSNILTSSNIATINHVIVNPSLSKYSWEANRNGAPTFADMTLCYGGNPYRRPYAWDKDRWRKHVVYTDENGDDFWLFDTFLALETETQYDENNKYVYSLENTSTPSAGKEQWSQQLSYWFDDVNGFQALDDCIDEAIATAGPYPHKRYVVFSLPDPIYFLRFADKSSSTTYWGKIGNTTMDFSKVDDRQKAYKWMIDQVRARFAAKNYKHIELAGFYILQECLSEKYNSAYKKFESVLSDVATYCNNYHEGLYWIPYGYSNSDSGHNDAIKNWTKYGFTATILQPNYYFGSWRDWTEIASYISRYNLGMEFEFEGTHGEGGWSMDETRTSASILETVMTDNDADGTPKGSPNPRAKRNKDRFREYMNVCKNKNFYGNTMLVLYSGTDGWVELANSTHDTDKSFYHEVSKFFIKNPLKQSGMNSNLPGFEYGGEL